MATLMLPAFTISGGSSMATAEAVAVQTSAAARKLFIMIIAPSDHRREKRLRTHFTRPAQNFRRGSGFHDRALVHIDHGICDLARKAQLVRHHHHGHAAARPPSSSPSSQMPPLSTEVS